MAEHGGETKANDAHSGAAEVFISYASRDAAVAGAVVAALESSGIRCWIAPRDVVPGDFYAGAIVRAIDAAKATVLILSQNAARSPHVLREVERAGSKLHSLISFRIDAAPMPPDLEYFLNSSQWLDANAAGIEAASAKLVDALRTRLEKNPANERPAAPIVGTPAAPLAFAIPENSVAVLPFIDMSENRDQEYFSDGLSEELIAQLTRVKGLRVPARTSSFYFKGKQTTIAEIAKMLGVLYVLEGSVRKSGDNIRVTANLIRVDSGYQLWSRDLLWKARRHLQDAGRDIRSRGRSAEAVVSGRAYQGGGRRRERRSLHAVSAVSRQSGAAITAGSGTSRALPEAGAAHSTPALLRRGRCMPRRRTILYEAGGISFQQAADEAREAAARAIALDPRLCAAHMAMARVHAFFDWDWDAMNADIKLARRFDPNDSDALRYAGVHALIRGNPDEAIDVLRSAVDRDPLEGANYMILGAAYLAAGRWQQSRQAFERSAHLNPLLGGHSGMGEALLIGKEPAEALAMYELAQTEEERLTGRALALFALGRQGAADEALAELARRFADTESYSIAMIHAYRGEVDQAFTWLERAYERRNRNVGWLKSSPLLHNLKGDPRYEAMLRKLKLLAR